MRHNTYTGFTLGLSVACGLMTNAWAAEGDLAASSSADILIQADINDLVRISRLDDLNLGSFDGSNDLSANDDFCVYRNGLANYDITVTAAEGSFVLVDDSNTLAYSLTIAGSPVSHAIALSLDNADTDSVSCNDSDNVNVAISIDSNDLQSVPAGAYTGTLTLTVAPQ